MAKKNAFDISQNAKKNEENKRILLNLRIGGIRYFESENIKIQVVFNILNEDLVSICRKEFDNIRDAEQAGNKIAPEPWESRDKIRLFKILEVDRDKLIILFYDKFNEARLLRGLVTDKEFARYELIDLKHHYSECFNWFPIFNQWQDFLEKVFLNGIDLANKQKKYSEAWWQVGIRFASGELYDCLKEKNENIEQVAKYFFNMEYKKYRPVISDSYRGNSRRGNKNIFTNAEKIEQIKAHFNNINRKIDGRFLEAIQSI